MKIDKIITLIILLSTLLFSLSFSSSKKKLLKKVYYDNKLTFYCQNPYKIKKIKNKEKTLIIQNSNKYTPRNKITKNGKINIRAKRVEWEHIVPAENFGRHLLCWREGDDKCVTKKGKHFRGRRCCKKVSSIFREMESDMMNLVPAIGEINADRKNFRYMDTKKNLKNQYGECKFLVNFKEKKVCPANYTKGFIARTYFYFTKKYNINLSKREKRMFKVWDKNYPPTKWEQLRKSRIESILKKVD